MGKLSIRKISIIIALMVCLAFLAWQLIRLFAIAEPLSAAEAASKVQELYHGEIVEVSELQQGYRVRFERTEGIYEVDIDKENGQIGSMIRTSQPDSPQPQQSTQPPQGSESTTEDHGEASDPSTPPEDDGASMPSRKPSDNRGNKGKNPRPYITEEEAAKIANQHIAGEIDDIDLIRSKGIPYYMVEIEREDGEEGTVQINAISGEVKAIIWDD